ncbi:hypothetical protein [Prosthecobacter sp.]|uniref:hypothetical protein n=1 Tax=Prosthecobacter sp. TaxID=1965333 RepID=UPI0037835D7C
MVSPALFLSLVTVAAFLYSHVLMRLALRPWERVHDEHWTERARWLWQARKSRAAIALSVIILSALTASEFNKLGTMF